MRGASQGSESEVLMENASSAGSSDSVSVSVSPLTASCRNESFYFVDLTQVGAVRTVLFVLYMLVMVVALVGNQVIIWAILLRKHMRTATNWYILNLAVADFLTAALVMPLKVLEDLADCELTRYVMTRTTCAVASYLMPVIVFASIITLICISVERFVALVYPLTSIKFRACRSKAVLLLCWAVPAVICTPFLAYDGQVFAMESEYGSIARVKCQSVEWTLFGDDADASRLAEFVYAVFLFLVVYALPALVILVTSVCIAVSLRHQPPILATPCDADAAYSFGQNSTSSVAGLLRKPAYNRQDEQKKRVARMVNFVALFFLFSWTPFYVLNLLTLMYPDNIPHHLFTYLVAHLLGFINAAVSPIICFIMSERFRHCLLDAVNLCLFCCPRLRASWMATTRRMKVRSISISTQSPTSKCAVALRRTLTTNTDIRRSPARLSEQPSTSRRHTADGDELPLRSEPAPARKSSYATYDL